MTENWQQAQPFIGRTATINLSSDCILMSYQVLARKWRPQVFADVVGQSHVLTALANGLSLGRLHHAYLFSGTRGVGKTTIARLLAKGLNCLQGVTATPCGECENCREIEAGRFVDLIEIDAASRTKVEDTRELLDNVQYAPTRGRFKVYLIDEVHMLSRHSFNALLKTLEEPPEHVKFLLATTDPQKLPVTILSRCLQFHLKALDTQQISAQLEHILQQENIEVEASALPLIARAAAGSLRDALSLLDQAIALGEGKVVQAAVTTMLGSLDHAIPLALIQALSAGNGDETLRLVQHAISLGADFETLLVETLRLLHTIAMLQLSSSMLNDEYANQHQALRELARVISPEDLQLYYQILLMGRKDLAFAPDPRMGVEMTLLRALAFQPQSQPEAQTQSQSQSQSQPEAQSKIQTQPLQSVQQSELNQVRLPAEKIKTTELSGENSPPLAIEESQPDNLAVNATAVESPVALNLEDTTSKLLQARTQLLRQGANPLKKREPAAPIPRPATPGLQRLAAHERKQQQPAVSDQSEKTSKERYRWRAQTEPVAQTEVVTTPKALRSALSHEKTPELTIKLAEEAMQRDGWAADIAKMKLPKLVQQLALNAWRADSINPVTLNVRTGQMHLNTVSARAHLVQELSKISGETVELIIHADDNPQQLTPLEWRQVIYEEKLEQARQALVNDSHLQTLLKLFDAELDEESIRPV